jgi:hypothetical protein
MFSKKVFKKVFQKNLTWSQFEPVAARHLVRVITMSMLQFECQFRHSYVMNKTKFTSLGIWMTI